MTKRDFYEVLGVSRNAQAGEIKKAHRKLARKYHPDAAGKDADVDAKFKEIQEAYETLHDKEKRKTYDQFGHAGQRMSGGAGGSGFGGFGDMFSGGGGGGGFGDIFEQMRAAQGGQQRPRQGKDISHNIQLGFMEAISGTTREVNLSRTGCGSTNCCQENLVVKIPQGIAPGAKIRLKGKGEQVSQGVDGDLIINISVGSHPIFWRDGLDLMLTVPLTIAEATLGAKIEIPTLNGCMSVTIPAGASGGQKMRLKEKGISLVNGECGDMYLVLKVVTPKGLSEASAAILEDFAQAHVQEDIRQSFQTAL